jgi:hypothetical protein
MSFISIAAASFTRPADTTAYASGDLVANSTTAGSVIPMTFSIRPENRGSMIRRARIKKTGTSIASASFRLHIYETVGITCANGDNGVWSTNNMINYVGSIDITLDKAFTDGAQGVGAPSSGSELNYDIGSCFGLLEARGAYTPASAEVFTVELEMVRS